LAGGLASTVALAYPGGTPDFQTDMVPACAACHSSTSADDLAGAGPRAEKELAENKHVALVLAGEKGYADLSEADRVQLAEHIRAVDANSAIELEHPAQVAPGETFQITVRLTGGAGPVVGLALVDAAHRWFAKSVTSTGLAVLGAPTIIGPDGKPQDAWLGKRPEKFGKGLTFVNILGVESDAAGNKWSKSKVIFNLKAPDKPGDYPIVGAYFYGTEKASALGFVEHPVYGKLVRGTYAGKSGRIKFTKTNLISVK
jgi:cytochrome c553